MTIGSGGGYAFYKRTAFNIEVMTNDCVENVPEVVEGISYRGISAIHALLWYGE